MGKTAIPSVIRSYHEIDETISPKLIQKIKNVEKNKRNLFLDVDGVLCAMQYNPEYKNVKNAVWDSVYRTDFCHWINSIHTVLDMFCNVFIISNYSHETEKTAKHLWLKNNIKFYFHLILNKEGNSKAIFASSTNDVLVDDTLKNLDEWHHAGGDIFAYQYITCEKGRRHLLRTLLKK